MAKAKGPERIDNLVKTLRKWQGIERKSIDSCAEIMEKTDNPLIRDAGLRRARLNLNYFQVRFWVAVPKYPGPARVMPSIPNGVFMGAARQTTKRRLLRC